MDELGTSFHATSNQAESASGESRQSLVLVEDGNAAVEQAYEGMISLKEKVDAIANQILRLSEQTHEIGTVTTLVSDLASQTNMLALNAAVEAARAGDHGKGFSIVATEIRKLADESKRSAERIHGFIADIQKATNSTVMATEEGTKTVDRGLQLAQSTGETFRQLAASARNLSQSVQQINLNVKQQASAVVQVVEAMNSLNAAARETAAGIAQTKVTVDLLNDSAQRLKSIV
jgi:methyl-accepting chemotaxis protein